LDDSWSARLAPSREATRWPNVLKTRVAYRLIDTLAANGGCTGSGSSKARWGVCWTRIFVWPARKLYRCLDRLLEHKTELFSFLQQRWKALLEAEFDVLSYDLTSTYFECDPPGFGKRRFGLQPG
jgi:hypothetical protein